MNALCLFVCQSTRNANGLTFPLELKEHKLNKNQGQEKAKENNEYKKKKKKDVKTQIQMMETNVIKDQIHSLKEK